MHMRGALSGPQAGASLRSVMAAGLTRFIDILMPPQCAVCTVPLERTAALCSRCWSRIDFIERPYCARLGLPFPYDAGPDALSAAALACDDPYDRVRSVTLYHGPARDLVTSLKFGARVSHAPMMAAWMARAGHELLSEGDLVIPVPMHWLRLASRRHNQAALLSRHIAARAGRAFAPGLLIRRRRTRPQTGLSAAARARNLTGAIAVARPVQVANRAIVLVDDVFTTGATAVACARALKRAGARRVDVLTFARVASEGENAILGG